MIELLQITPAVDIEQETSVGGGVNNPSAAAFSAAAFVSASCFALSSAAAFSAADTNLSKLDSVKFESR